MNNLIKQTLKIIAPNCFFSEKIVFFHIISRYFKIRNFKILSKFLDGHIYKKYHCNIEAGCEIGKKCVFPHPIGIVIGSGVKIGENVKIFQNVTIGGKRNKQNEELIDYPVIHDNVKIFGNTIILGSVEIGSGAIIGACSLVLNDVPPNAIYAGCPAKMIN